MPAASRATAVRLWTPSTTASVFQDVVYGAAVTSAPSVAPSSWNWTPATPTLSEAVAETVTVPLTLAPSAGAVSETTGGVVSAGVPVSNWLGTLTRNASSRPPPMLLVQMKYWPVTSRLPLGSLP